MQRTPDLIRWLALAALAEWLIGRSLTRAAIYIPKSAPLLAAFRGLTLAGQLALSLASLLALVTLVSIAFRGRRNLALSVLLSALVAASLVSMVVPLGGWGALLYHAATLIVVGLLVKVHLDRAAARPERWAVGVTALAMVAAHLYLLLPPAGEALGLAGPSSLAIPFFAIGELLFVLTPLAMWWAYGRLAPRWAWAVAGLVAAGFAGMRLSQPSMVGILAMWSSGLSLYLPLPLYAVSLAFTVVTVVAGVRSGHPGGWAMVLLAAAGLAPQLTTGGFYGLIALWALVSTDALAARPFLASARQSTPPLNPQPGLARALTR
jgi:hypothetical protein